MPQIQGYSPSPVRPCVVQRKRGRAGKYFGMIVIQVLAINPVDDTAKEAENTDAAGEQKKNA